MPSLNCIYFQRFFISPFQPQAATSKIAFPEASSSLSTVNYPNLKKNWKMLYQIYRFFLPHIFILSSVVCLEDVYLRVSHTNCIQQREDL